jgi:mono/diheme cytochrome c family protein
MMRLVVAGCVAALSVAVVIGQASQTTPTSKAASSSVARAQAAPQVPLPKSAAPAAAQGATTSPAQGAPSDSRGARALVDQYCVTCHNARLKTAGLLLDQLDLANLGEHAEIGEKVVRKMRAGLMPPTDARRPDAATMESLIRWMEGELDRGAETHLPAPGLHRLNRTEYSNAIRDLLALEVDASKFLPTDDSTHGFDNIAGALTMSPALMEAYLSAAGKISRLAIGNVDAATQWVWDVPADTAQNHHIEGLPFGTRGGIRIEHQFPADGEYAFNVKGVTGYFQRVLGGITGEKLEILIDGERVHLFDWDKEISNTTGRGKWTPRIPITAGHHVVGVTFLATNDVPGTELNKPFQRTMNTPGSIPGFIFYPHVGQVTIEGPHNATGAKDTASRQRIFVCRPATPREEDAPASATASARSRRSSPDVTASEDGCARTIVSTLAKRAFRRPSTAADLKVLLPFYQAARSEGGSFDDGIEAALQRVLADPEFIYRGEREPAALAAGRSYRLNDLELASRLSFFLWSSIPDDELIDVAAAGKLKDPAVLDRQVKRMLADPRSADLITNFTGQWLSVRSLRTVEPVVNLFPDFDDNLRNAFQREVELFFESIVREDRSVLDLLDADYTFVNERLAKHYGISNVYGAQFRRVTLPPEFEMRRGLLGKGALLTVTSNPARTSPVARGKWVQATLLGVEPPQPPPGVEVNIIRANDNTGNTKQPTMRQVLEQHRISPTCSACHKIFEPVGLALENFDGVGAWRTHDEGVPVDTTGKLPDGTPLDAGVPALRGSLLRYSDQFARVVAEKLLTYALGRGVEHDDMPIVRTIVRGAEANKYRFSSLVAGIVKSEPFQMNMKPAAAPVGQRAER